MWVHVVPTLLGGGERLFDGVTELGRLAFAGVVAAPRATHPRFSA